MAKFLSVYESMNRKRSLVHPNYHRLAVEQDGSYSYEIRSFQAETSPPGMSPSRHVPFTSRGPRSHSHLPALTKRTDPDDVGWQTATFPTFPPRQLSSGFRIQAAGRDSAGEAREHGAGPQEAADVRECECVFALAALGVFYDPTHPGHRAIWNKRMWEHTAKTVQKVTSHRAPSCLPCAATGDASKEPATRPSASGLHSGSGSTSAGSAPAAPQMSAKALGKRKASDAELPDRDGVGKGKALPTKPTQRTGGTVARIKRKTTRHSPRGRCRRHFSLALCTAGPTAASPETCTPPSNSTPTPSSCSSHAESQSGSTLTLHVVANEMPAPTCSSSSSEVTSEAAVVSEDRERNEPSMKALGKRKAADEDPSATPGGAVQEAGTPPAKRARVST
ncbi:hypothetical protein B0H21DRAFT_826275 [Amylocystis lapponica]|nr:hypothetical protein B0H21DRAFT_826275 [Amylocystis lapponica]